jgi:hypothetical protein
MLQIYLITRSGVLAFLKFISLWRDINEALLKGFFFLLASKTGTTIQEDQAVFKL